VEARRLLPSHVLAIEANSDRQCITVDEYEVGRVHGAGSRRVSGTTLAEPAVRPDSAAFFRVRALIVVA
jgi:hypothetical protein